MPDVELTKPAVQLRRSRIVYLTDLVHSDSREIKLGIITEVLLPDLRGVCACLPSELPDDQLTKIGPMARNVLERPMDGLWPIIHEAFKSSPGKALEALSARFMGSISILAPEPLELPKKWLLPRPANEIEEMVRKELPPLTEAEYFAFLFPASTDIKDPDAREDVTRPVQPELEPA